MITGVTPQKLSSPGLVLPFFILSAISYLVLTVLLFLSTDSFNLHYFHPKLLAITHVAALGFISSVIFGSLYQMFPVLFEVEVKYEWIGKLSFYFLLAGMMALSYSFWGFNVGLLFQIGGILCLLSFIFFALVFYSSVRACKNWKIEFDLVSTSVMWLLLTGLAGLLLVFNFSFPFIPRSHLEVLKIHSHIGMVGWILLLIMGVSSRLVPMFIIAKNLNTLLLKYSYYSVNAGLVLFCVTVYLDFGSVCLYASILTIEAGVMFFLYFIFRAFRERVRKKLDSGLRLTFGAFIILFIILPLALLIPSDVLPERNMMVLRILYGAMILLGFSGSLILGQTLKVVPFILWMYRFQKHSGTQKIPLPRELVSERISAIVMYLFLAGLGGFIVSAVVGFVPGIVFSSALLIGSALLFNLNIAKALFYKIK